MLTENRELMQQARAALKGKWGLAIAANLIYLALIGVGQLIPVIKFVSTLIITGPLLLGITAFFLAMSRRQEVALGQIFDGFQRFVDALVTYLWMVLFIFLWSLLFIVPGIMVALSYAMTFFLMSEDPTLKGKEALDKSKALMTNHRWKLFCLGLRFLGWFLVGALTFGIGFLWIIPYLHTSIARFYDDLLENGAVSSGQEPSKPAPQPLPGRLLRHPQNQQDPPPNRSRFNRRPPCPLPLLPNRLSTPGPGSASAATSPFLTRKPSSVRPAGSLSGHWRCLLLLRLPRRRRKSNPWHRLPCPLRPLRHPLPLLRPSSRSTRRHRIWRLP
jgi:uncharacterized membrane protein